MSEESATVTPLPPRTITTPTRRERSNAIRAAVEQFAAHVQLTVSERHLLGLIIDETLEAVVPKPSTVASGCASNEAAPPKL